MATLLPVTVEQPFALGPRTLPPIGGSVDISLGADIVDSHVPEERVEVGLDRPLSVHSDIDAFFFEYVLRK